MAAQFTSRELPFHAAGPADPSRATGTGGGENDHVIIVGAGFAGIGMAIRLKQSGIEDFTILERSDRVGGTWRDNTYPGIACDVPSHLYSYSFEPNPDWTRFFAPQKDILAYLERCADKYDVRRHMRFSAEVTGASFDERNGMWTVRLGDGSEMTARVLVSGSGHALTRPVYPDVPGRTTFRGKSMHSARWDHDYSLEGKAVAVVGTGASAIQIIPSIAAEVGRMHVMQRTASWVQPKPDRPISARAQKVMRERPYLQAAARRGIYWLLESMAVGYVVQPRLNRIRELTSLRFLRKNVRDPGLRAKLTPKFRLGCKRILLSNDYYRVLQQDNVELVTEPIAEIREHSIVTRDGKERPVDAIVYATGFETSEAKPPFPITGRGGADLHGVWRDGISAYRGTTIPGFPNAFLLLGPNTGLGHSSMIFMMESQFAYVLDALKTIRARRLKYVDVRSDVERSYNDRLQKRLAGTVWNAGGCASWYLTSTGRNTISWPGFTFEFRRMLRRFDAENYILAPRSEPAYAAAR
ncbi:MAG TPA: NAD(P)/FAD-dependent oxidoreductase [Polyangiaceae bacterium]|jgi:cation diffusion facilitator CzcD-associated flavoprotein CzcO|nr:NAD(P)/FAD-dependent oxidoreductase [Polyangiaceae bacterium]